MHRWQKCFHFVQESVVRNAELGAGEQGSDYLPSSVISLLCCSKHHTEEQQRGRQDSTIIQTAQIGFKTIIQGFRIAMRDFTLAEDDVVTNRLLIICTILSILFHLHIVVSFLLSPVFGGELFPPKYLLIAAIFFHWKTIELMCKTWGFFYFLFSKLSLKIHACVCILL